MSGVGSYNSNEFKNLSNELERLKKQALSFQKLETTLLRDWAGIKSTDSLLEVGCGPGFITPVLIELVREGRLTACDTNEEFLKLARTQQMTAPVQGLDFLLSNGTTIPVQDGSHTASYLRFVMQHVPNNENLLKEVSRCLTIGGKICLLDTDDGLNIHFPADELLSEIKNKSQEIQSKKGGDRFAGRSLSRKLSQSGFTKIKTKIVQMTPTDLPFSALANIAFGFKAELCGLKNELLEWIKENEPKAQSGQLFLSAGAVVAIGEKGEL